MDMMATGTDFMGKSWKEKPGKYRHNKDFQKKQQKKHGGKPIFQEESYPYDRQPTTEYSYVG